MRVHVEHLLDALVVERIRVGLARGAPARLAHTRAVTLAAALALQHAPLARLHPGSVSAAVPRRSPRGR